MILSLLITRILLIELGVIDYGIYNLIMGVVGLLAFLNSAMAVSTQRYLSFYIGAKQHYKLKKVFYSSICLHLGLAIIVLFVLELAGLFLFDGFLTIPEDRTSAAKFIYQCLVATSFITISFVPFEASIISHEKLVFESIVSIIEVLLKLLSAFCISLILDNKLETYALCIVGITLITRVIKAFYCFKNFNECQLFLKGLFDLNIFKEMSSFAGWNSFGALCGVAKNQGLAVIMNLFFGTIVNAAFGIAAQVGSQIFSFSSNMLKAVNPQIMKNEGMGERKSMITLSLRATKFSFFLLSFLLIPFALNIVFIFKIWLKDIPEHTIIFALLYLGGTLTNQLTIGLQTAIQSGGNIKLYQSIVGSILLLNLPVAFFIYYLGYPAYYGLISFILIELLACFFRLFISRKILGLSIRQYYRDVLLKIIPPFAITFIICAIPAFILPHSFVRLVVTGILSILSYSLMFYYLGMDPFEREQLIKIKEKLLTFKR
ncbi:Na+-driven multidrug efflux pump [Aquimarina brevivitae]|uniref:Na+-driven multidrug efflux pump n=2 Tax=Aquimarina brevivitae TaxID=323412 RepID=A0A4Q7PHM9_9FLAO|nr:Na+-driven multidrug efflux pump [Aquimarina brevivitae]